MNSYAPEHRTTRVRTELHGAASGAGEVSEYEQSAEDSGPRIEVGTDLVHIAEIERSVKRFGLRYLTRVYTAAELSTCRTGAGEPDPSRLAARFAAKEATVKALRHTSGVAYSNIEVETDELGRPSLRLSGAIARHALDVGVRSTSVSMSHDGEYATAVVAVITQPTNRQSVISGSEP